MTEGLPKGLIATSDNVSSEIEREDRVAVEDISRLWRGTFCHCKIAVQGTKTDVLLSG